MLGIAMVVPSPEYYLISGGSFFLSTLFNLYTALLTYWYYFIIFLMAAVALVYFHRYVQKKNHIRGQVLFTLLVLIIIIFYTSLIIPASSIPLGFRDFLLRDYEPIQGIGLFSTLKRELRSGILNDDTGDRLVSHHAFYGLLWLFTGLSALVTYLLLKRSRRQNQAKNTTKPEPARSRTIREINKRLLPVLMVIMCTITAVLVVLIPVDYGILIKPNHYPRVKLTVAPGVELMPNRSPDPDMQSSLWLLRENKQELLVHAVYLDKDTGKPVFKILVVNKEKVETIEILKRSFILETK